MDATPIIIKKKRVQSHGHHGGSWKVAYADFVTAMMAFFMVMWIMGLSDETRALIQGYFNDPIGFTKNEPKSKTVIPFKGSPNTKPSAEKWQPGRAAEADHEAMQQLKSDLEKQLAASPELKKFLDHIEFSITDEGLRIEFLEDRDDFFESGQAVLKPGALKVLKSLAPKLGSAHRPMVIEGHTDAVPFGGDPLGNYRLSSERALAVQGALDSFGVSASRFEYVKGLADKDLRDAAHPTSAINRRVSLLLKFVTTATSTEQLPRDEAIRTMKEDMIHAIDIRPGKPNIVGKKK